MIAPDRPDMAQKKGLTSNFLPAFIAFKKIQIVQRATVQNSEYEIRKFVKCKYRRQKLHLSLFGDHIFSISICRYLTCFGPTPIPKAKTVAFGNRRLSLSFKPW